VSTGTRQQLLRGALTGAGLLALEALSEAPSAWGVPYHPRSSHDQEGLVTLRAGESLGEQLYRHGAGLSLDAAVQRALAAARTAKHQHVRSLTALVARGGASPQLISHQFSQRDQLSVLALAVRVENTLLGAYTEVLLGLDDLPSVGGTLASLAAVDARLAARLALLARQPAVPSPFNDPLPRYQSQGMFQVGAQ
jgi:hypothetical protein